MTNGHLLDGQIQEILDHMPFQPGMALPPHLQACAACRERFEQYRQLYAGLAADPGFTLPLSFADSLLAKIPVPRPVFWARPAVWLSLAAGASALALAGLFLLVDMRPLTGAMARIFNAMAASFRPLVGQFQQLLAKLDYNSGLFILGGLGLLGAAFFDRILQRQIPHRSR
jgi:hypothetical protein